MWLFSPCFGNLCCSRKILRCTCMHTSMLTHTLAHLSPLPCWCQCTPPAFSSISTQHTVLSFSLYFSVPPYPRDCVLLGNKNDLIHLCLTPSIRPSEKGFHWIKTFEWYPFIPSPGWTGHYLPLLNAAWSQALSSARQAIAKQWITPSCVPTGFGTWLYIQSTFPKLDLAVMYYSILNWMQALRKELEADDGKFFYCIQTNLHRDYMDFL